MRVFAAILVWLVVAGVSGESVFIEEPSPAVVAENDTAVFRCRVSRGAQAWAVNGIFISSISNPDFEEHPEPASDGGPQVETLSIVAQSGHNVTTVQCFVFPDNINSSATLYIQGPLAAVKDLTPELGNGFILFRWRAPFSLNLTNTEPDITYCVDVFRGTELVVSECGLTETSYNLAADEMNRCGLFTVEVTPVNGAGNGSTASVEGHYVMTAPELSGEENVTYELVNGTQAGRLSISIEELHSVSICTCELVFTSVDDVSPPIIGRSIIISDCHSMLTASGGIIVDTTNATSETTQDAVPLHRIYELDIVLQNSAGNATINQVDLSTHGVQDMDQMDQMDSENKTMLEIKFIENTVAPGCVVIIVVRGVEFVFIGYLPDGSIRHLLRVSGLNNESYNVSAYDLENRTTSGRYMARNITVDGSTGETNEPPTVDIEGAKKSESVRFQPDSNRIVCANCSDTNVTQCLLLMHPLGNLTEIEALYVPRNEDRCIQVRNSGEYLVSSFGISVDDMDSITALSTVPVLFTVPPTTAPAATVPTDDGGGSVALAVIVVVVMGMGMVVMVVVGVVMWKRKQKSTTKKPSCYTCLRCIDFESSYSDEKRLTTDSAVPSLTRVPSPIPTDPQYEAVILRKQRPPCRMATDSCSPTVPPKKCPSNFEKPCDVANAPDKVVEEGTTGPVYTTANPDRRFRAPPPEETKTNYDVVGGMKSEDGEHHYAFPDVKTSNKPKPVDETSVAYDTVTHTVPVTAVPVCAAAVTPQGTRLEEVLGKLHPVRGKWRDLGAQFKQDEDRVEEIFTKNTMDGGNEAHLEETCLKEVIGNWYMNNDFDHSWVEVVTALEAIDERVIAQEIRAAYGIAQLPGTPECEFPHTEGADISNDQPKDADIPIDQPGGSGIDKRDQPRATSPSLDDETYQSSSQGPCNEAVHCDSDSEDSTLAVSTKAVGSQASGNDSNNRKFGYGETAVYSQKPFVKVTTAEAEYYDHSEEAKCNQTVAECAKNDSFEQRKILFVHQYVPHTYTTSRKDVAWIMYNEKMEKAANSHNLRASRKCTRVSQPASSDEGEMTLCPPPSLLHYANAKDERFGSRQHFLRCFSKSRDTVQLTNDATTVDESDVTFSKKGIWPPFISDGAAITSPLPGLGKANPGWPAPRSIDQDTDNTTEDQKAVNRKKDAGSFDIQNIRPEQTFTDVVMRLLGCLNPIPCFASTTSGAFDGHNYSPWRGWDGFKPLLS